MTESLLAQDLFSVRDKTIFMTGSSSFLGRTMSRTLLVNGARLIVVGKSERFRHFCDSIRNEFGKRSLVRHDVDLDDSEAFTKILELIAEQEQCDVIINNAHALGAITGFNSLEGMLENASPDQIHANMAGGVIWPLSAVRILGKGMVERRRGSIINIASMYAEIAPNPRLYDGTRFLNPPGYSAAKAGMLAFTRYVASFWGQYNIRCNAISPGPISNLEEKTENSVNPSDPFLNRLADRTSLNRIGRPADLAGILLFLASDASSYMTGQNVIVDGGWTVT